MMSAVDTQAVRESLGLVAIVCGGKGNEREISLRTGRAFQAALERLGVEHLFVDVGTSSIEVLLERRPAVVLNALHGLGGEDGALQGFCEMVGLSYTGSGITASAIAMDKVASKCVFERFGVPTPAWTIAGSDSLEALGMALPVVVKPSLEGSSVGVSLVHTPEEWRAAYAAVRTGRGQVLVESLIEGRELTVGIVDGDRLGIVEIEAAEGFYDFEAKYKRGDTAYRISPLDPETDARVWEAALAAYRVLGCRGVARVDVMLDRDGQPWVLEANTVPGMTETSLVPKLAAALGESFEDFTLRVLAGATRDELVSGAGGQ